MIATVMVALFSPVYSSRSTWRVGFRKSVWFASCKATGYATSSRMLCVSSHVSTYHSVRVYLSVCIGNCAPVCVRAYVFSMLRYIPSLLINFGVDLYACCPCCKPRRRLWWRRCRRHCFFCVLGLAFLPFPWRQFLVLPFFLQGTCRFFCLRRLRQLDHRLLRWWWWSQARTRANPHYFRSCAKETNYRVVAKPNEEGMT